MSHQTFEQLADALQTEAAHRFPHAAPQTHFQLAEFVKNQQPSRMELRKKIEELYDNLNGSALIGVLERFPELDI